MKSEIERYLGLIRRHLPDFAAERAQLLHSSGQFNTVLCVNDEWIFRFPKSPDVAAELAQELQILPRLQGKLPFPIPNPQVEARDPVSGQLLFMAYPLLPGEPLQRNLFAELEHDNSIVKQLANDLATFLQALHGISPAALRLESRGEDARQAWAQIYDDVQEKLYAHMRADAQQAVSRNFKAALDDQSLWRFDVCLIHGDFGTGNILCGDGRISGIIDFGFCGIGDPAQDLGALISSYGEPFVERVMGHYPALREGLRRARFYRQNYALIQALYALRDDNPADFEDGIADYR